jgi:hypothetical protein
MLEIALTQQCYVLAATFKFIKARDCARPKDVTDVYELAESVYRTHFNLRV